MPFVFQDEPTSSGGRFVFEDELDPQKKKKRGITDVLSDAGTAVWEGAKSTARMVGAAGNTFGGDLADVEDYALRQQLAQEKRPEAVKALTAEIERRKQANPQGGVLDAIRDVGGAMIDNPEGAAQFVIEQAPNSAVALGAGWAGAKLGAAGGAMLGPVGAVVGGIGGFLGGMFLGNTLLETGGKAIDKAEGGFTEAERGEAIREGAVKGGVITTVDAATLGAGNVLSKSLGRAAINAGARAEAQVLADAGVDITSRAAIETALAKNPALREAAKSAGEAAAKAASTIGSKAAMAGTGLTMETVGEGTGEYLGELAATGKADVYDAVMEAAAGFSQSAPEVAWNMRQASGNDLNARNIQRQVAGLTPAAPSPAPAAAPAATAPAPAAASPAATPAADPTARLAELEILAEQRDLTPVEQKEAADLLTAMSDEQADVPLTDEGKTPAADATLMNEGATPAAEVVPEPVVGPQGGTAQELSPASVALQAAQIRRREAPGTADPRIDTVAAQETYLQGIARENPEQARAIAAAFRANPEQFGEAAGVSPEMVGRYASIIERRLALSTQPAQPEPVSQPAQPGTTGEGAGVSRPTQVASDFWSFAKSKGYKPGDIKVGTPEHAALKAEYDALRQGQTAERPPVEPLNNLPDPALQNRDRSRAASVVQMSDIARNPDYMRLGPSRTPDSGAPMVFAVGDDVSRIPAENFGRQDVAVMSDGQRVPFRYAVVDASQVNPSHFADGRQNPEFASTVAGTIKALNNGRTAGVRAAYELGTAGQYAQDLAADEALHGVPAEVIARTPNPMLVRVYSERDNTADMAAKSQSQALGLSPAELARQDAPLLDTTVLSVYEPGEITSAANRDFVRAFIGKLQAAGQDVAGMMTGDGQLSQDGRKRIQAALMQAAYGDSDIVEEMFDSTDTDIKAIGEALKTVAGQWANMRDSAKLGAINPQTDITQNLIQAIGLIRKARRDGTMLYDLVNQPDLMTGETPDATTVGVLRMFYSGQYMTRAVGKDKLTKSLSDYVNAAMATSADPGMFGDAVTAGEILATINPITEGQSDAEAQPEEGRGQPAGSGDPGVGAGEARTAVGRQRAGESGAGVAADRGSEPGQDAAPEARQQVGQGDPRAEEGDGAAAARAGAGQQEGADGRAAAAEGRAGAADSQAVKAKKPKKAAKPKSEPDALPADQVQQLERDFRTFPTQILNNLLERGEAAKLYKAAGVKGASAFGDLAMDDKAAAYVKFVQQGGKPVENLPKDYNAWVKSEERAAEVRRLQSDRVVRQENGKPFKTKTSAQQFQERYDLTGTHEVKEVEGGFELRQLSPAAQAELKRKAEGRESYTEAQAAVAAEMGIGQTPDGEWDVTDEQFDELERRTQARMRGETVEPVLTAPTREDVLAQQQRAETAEQRDAREQIRRESEAGAGMFALEMQDGRQDNTGDLFRQAAQEQPSGQQPAEQQSAAEDAPKPEVGERLEGWIKARETEQGVTLFSRSPEFDAEVDRAIDAGLRDDKQALRQQIDVGIRTPEVLRMLGVEDKPVYTNRNLIAKMHLEHGVPKEQLRDLAGLLENPALVFESDTQPGRLLLVTEAVVNGSPVVVAVEPNGSSGRLEVVYLPSMYPRNDAQWKFPQWIRAGKLKYADKSRSRLLATTAGLELPGVVQRSVGFTPAKYMTESDRPQAGLSRGRAGGMTESAVRQVADTITSRWTQAPTVVVVPNMQDMRVPEAARQEDARQRAAGATGVPRGFYHRGAVYLVADGLGSVRDVAETLFHEALGHYGLRAVFGSALDGILDQIAVARPDLMRPKAKEYGKDLKVLKQRREVAEEVLAEMAQTKPELGFVKRAIAAIRTWLRQNVPAFKDLALTDAEIINNFILPARGWVERGERAMRPGSQIALSRSAMKSVTANIDRGLAALAKQPGANAWVVTGYEVDPDRAAAGRATAALTTSAASRTRDGEGAGSNGIIAPGADAGNTMLSRTQSQTDTPEFKRWFGDSKVVDEQGRPLVMYHGTAGDISVFRPNSLGLIFTTPDVNEANAFAFGSGANVLPVYVNAEKPFDPFNEDHLEAIGAYPEDNLWDSANVENEGVIAKIKAAGFDGFYVKDRGSEQMNLAVFRPEQIKSATGNRGTFDPENPDIRFSRSTLGNTPPTPPQNPNAWQKLKAKALELTSPDAIESLIYEYQDKNIDLKRLRDHIKELGGTITDLNDAYLGEELYHKRLAKRTQDFLSEELKPLLADMRARGVDMPTLERYLHARHAPEANRVLAERNPNAQMIEAGKAKARAEVKALEVQLQRARAQGAATKAIEQALEQALAERDRWTGAQAFKGTEAERLSLSGMSDAEAAAFMGGLPAGQRVHLDALAARVDAMQAKTLEVLEKYGLMDKATLDAWRSTYQFYVPLHRDEAHPDAVSHPIGQGFSTKGDASKRRTGSNEKVTNILAHIAMQREAALTRGEKNRVAKKLYLMAAQNPDPEIWSVDKPPMMKTVDRETGFVRTTVDPTYRNKPNVVMVRIGGKDHAITFNERNPKAVRMAQSIKGADVGDLNAFESIMGKATRWLASVNTQYNPIFGIINFARDVQAAILQLSTTPLKGQERAVAAYVPAALKGIYAEVRSRRKGQPRGTGQWAKLWEDMQDEGGTTGYRELFITPDERVKALTKELNALERGKVSEAAHAVVDWLSDYNETMENAVRLAAYKVALDQGMSKERAASLAKNLTVNFNRRGRQTARLGAYYAFLNAAIQGTTRMVETLRGPLGRKIMLGGVMLGAVNALIGMAMMGGDDDEDDNWEKIPDFVKERSLIVPLGREDYLAIPMPLGYHVFPNLGRKAVEMMMHDDPTKGVGSHIAEMLRITLDAFNPLGGSENLVQMVTPTPFDPAVALMMNRDWTGKPIYREDNSNLDPTPGHQRTKDTASAFSKAVSEALNKITGGTDYQPGAISWTPDQIDYVIGQITGGLGREILKLENSITAPLTGDELPAYKIPLVGRLYGNTRGPANNAELFYEHVRELNQIENEIRGRARDGGDVAGYMAEEPLSALVGMGNAAENQIRKLRQYRAEVVRRAAPGYQDEVKRINEQMGEVMKLINQEVRRAKQEARQ